MNDLTKFVSFIASSIEGLQYSSSIRWLSGRDNHLPVTTYIKLPYEDGKWGYLCKMRPHDPKEFVMRSSQTEIEGLILSGRGSLITGNGIKSISSKSLLSVRSTFYLNNTHWTIIPEMETHLILLSDNDLFSAPEIDMDEATDLIHEFGFCLNPTIKPIHFRS